MAYDRDAIVGCLKRHYDLLVRMAYLNPTTIQEPPPSGWSDDQLAIDILRAMGRSEKVIDLLRHLPYLHETKHYDEDIHIYPETMAISYRNDTGWFRGQTAESCQGKTLGYLCLMPFEEDCPPGFISLTYGNLATDWIIDIDEGVMFASDGNIVDANVPEDQPWRRGGKPRDIKDYFDEVYFDMVSLKVVPAPPAGRWGPAIIYGEGPEGQVMKRLLTQHGWPDDLSKVQYLQAVNKERAEYLDNVQNKEKSPPASTESVESDSSHSEPPDSPLAGPSSDSVHRIEGWVLEGDKSQGATTS